MRRPRRRGRTPCCRSLLWCSAYSSLRSEPTERVETTHSATPTHAGEGVFAGASLKATPHRLLHPPQHLHHQPHCCQPYACAKLMRRALSCQSPRLLDHHVPRVPQAALGPWRPHAPATTKGRRRHAHCAPCLPCERSTQGKLRGKAVVTSQLAQRHCYWWRSYSWDVLNRI